jgi:hypothetical protein
LSAVLRCAVTTRYDGETEFAGTEVADPNKAASAAATAAPTSKRLPDPTPTS